MQKPFSSKLLSDLLLNDLVDNQPMLFTPNSIRMAALGNCEFNKKTYLEIFEITKVLSLELNKLTENGKNGIAIVNKTFINTPLTDFNTKMINSVLKEFFTKFGCSIRIRENHAAINDEPRLKIKVAWN